MRKILPVLVFLFLVWAVPCLALTKGFQANSFQPATDGGPFFTVYSADTLKFGRFTEGTSFTYGWRSFQLMQGGSRQRGIVDHQLVQNFNFAMGLPDGRLELGVLIPVGWVVNWKDPAVVGAPGQNKTVLGDITLDVKARLVQFEKYNFGISFLPFLSLPTGDGKYYMGDGSFSGGGKFIFGMKPAQKLSIALNLGILIRKKFVFASINHDDQITAGVGAAYDFTEKFSAVTEINTNTRMGAPFAHKYEAPTEWLGGLKYKFANGFVVGGGVGAGIIYGSYVPLLRGFAGISYFPKTEVVVQKEE